MQNFPSKKTTPPFFNTLEIRSGIPKWETVNIFKNNNNNDSTKKKTMGCAVSQEKAMQINKGGKPEKKLEKTLFRKKNNNNDRIIQNLQSGDDDDTDDSTTQKTEEAEEDASLSKDPLSIIIMGMEQNMYEKKEPDITLKEFREELKGMWAEIQKTRPKITYHQFLLEHNKIKDN